MTAPAEPEAPPLAEPAACRNRTGRGTGTAVDRGGRAVRGGRAASTDHRHRPLARPKTTRHRSPIHRRRSPLQLRATEPPPAAEQPPATGHPPPAPASGPRLRHPHWLLSLFTPAPADAVDWRRGNYTVLARGGRVDSPAGSGELKKQIQMVAEGSVLYAEARPRGSAADVAPDGFAHPVFRAGFALAIPLPEVS